MTLEKITDDNVWDLIELEVNEDQKSFVASNTTSIIDAYIAITSGGHALPFGIYDGQTPIGFVMIGYKDKDEDAPLLARENYSLWRLMIDKRYQGKGFGKQAVRQILDVMRTFPLGSEEYCCVSYEPENERAKKLYASFGFEETGEIYCGENVAVVKL